MTSLFERRSSTSTHHGLWAELERIELALAQDDEEIASGDGFGNSRIKERQLHLREALALLGS